MSQMHDPSIDAAATTPHVMYVAWGFPPSRGGGVYRALATANALVDAGLRVTVLTADRETFTRFTGADFSLEERIDPRLVVRRVPFDWPAREWDIRRWPKSRVMTPIRWRDRRRQQDERQFPEAGYGAWRSRLEEAAEQVHHADPVDVVVATANPHVDFAAAWMMHERHGIPYFLDQRDGWSLDVFTGERIHSPESPVGQWESRLISGAHELWLVNEPIRDWHAAAYPAAADRMRVVMNGWDDDVSARGAERESDEVRFAYLGTVSGKVPISEFLAGWSRAGANGAIGKARAEIHGHLGFFRTVNEELLSALDRAGKLGVHYQGPVAKGDVGSVYANADALLLMLGTGRYVTSGKVFEYMATGLPIVSIHDLDNACTPLLRDYPGWYPAASLSPDDIAAALVAAAEAARTDTDASRQARRAYAERFRREHQLAPAVAAVKSLADQRKTVR